MLKITLNVFEYLEDCLVQDLDRPMVITTIVKHVIIKKVVKYMANER